MARQFCRLSGINSTKSSCELPLVASKTQVSLRYPSHLYIRKISWPQAEKFSGSASGQFDYGFLLAYSRKSQVSLRRWRVDRVTACMCKSVVHGKEAVRTGFI